MPAVPDNEDDNKKKEGVKKGAAVAEPAGPVPVPALRAGAVAVSPSLVRSFSKHALAGTMKHVPPFLSLLSLSSLSLSLFSLSLLRRRRRRRLVDVVGERCWKFGYRRPTAPLDAKIDFVGRERARIE
jgi:hypothetical protein